MLCIFGSKFGLLTDLVFVQSLSLSDDQRLLYIRHSVFFFFDSGDGWIFWADTCEGIEFVFSSCGISVAMQRIQNVM